MDDQIENLRKGIIKARLSGDAATTVSMNLDLAELCISNGRLLSSG